MQALRGCPEIHTAPFRRLVVTNWINLRNVEGSPLPRGPALWLTSGRLDTAKFPRNLVAEQDLRGVVTGPTCLSAVIAKMAGNGSTCGD